MPGNSNVERLLDNIKSDDGRSTLRGEDDQYGYTGPRNESVDPSFRNKPQASTIEPAPIYRAKPHEYKKSSRNVPPPRHENFDRRSIGDSRSGVNPRSNNQGPRSLQQLPVSNNSPRIPYYETAPQSAFPRPYSSTLRNRFTSHSVSRLQIRSPEIAPVSHPDTFSVARPQRVPVGVASYRDTYVIPTLNHTVQESSGLSADNPRIQIIYAQPTREGLVQRTIAQETRRAGFRTAEENDAYGRYLRSGGQLDSIGSGTGNFSRMGMPYDKPARETWARDMWASEMLKQNGLE
ncbi:uncharacterized protein EAF01_000599 [Botrytis porri]|uniref:uncharacterized protein n=1 Tax=Botrytis porri TaxID=87229 RepID=UPI001900D7F4|nr:uncharacterized protein EAF01_000599 [Botrytis porri]KAF7914193.1 hypothetical protein EAF01_000599 [Botrytis porri]